MTQRGRGWEERKAVPHNEGMKLHCLDSLAGLKKISSSPQLMGQPAAVLEGLNHKKPQGLGCCMSLHLMLKLDILIYPSLTNKQFNHCLPPHTASVFLPSYLQRQNIPPSGSVPEISSAISEWGHSFQLYRRKRGHRDKPECAPWSKWWARLPRGRGHPSPHLSRFLPGHNCTDTARYPGWETVHTLIYNIPLTLLFPIPWLHNSLPQLLTEALYLFPSSLL